MYILGIDYGTKKLGLAVLEDSTGVCSPLPIVKNDEHLWDKLAEIIASYRISTIAIGLPSYENTAKKVQRFVNELSRRHAVSIHLTSEDNTSLVVKKELTTRKQKDNLDSFSAVAILQQWAGKKNAAST
jgi:putative Holliday junction resolvase